MGFVFYEIEAILPLMFSSRKKFSGFTLIEMMVVMVIIALLASMGVMGYR